MHGLDDSVAFSTVELLGLVAQYKGGSEKVAAATEPVKRPFGKERG